jgi:LPS-assembly protein
MRISVSRHCRRVVAPLITGQRIYAWPTVAWARQGAAWSVVARTGIHLRHYDLNEDRPGLPNKLDYAIPITSLDGGLVFERDWNAFGQNFVQTLEPRAFYVYTPYHNQSAAPVFDSALDDFNFAQLFSVNRYLGQDRIGDANQLAFAVVSRLVEAETGAERVRVAVGQRFYFRDQQVTLTEAPRSANSSDVLLVGEGRLSEQWALNSLLQQNLDTGRTERFTGGVRYTPAPGKTFNASYRFSRVAVDTAVFQASELKQFDLSAQWPISDNWTFLGRWNYSLFDRKTLEAVAGVEYNGGCWVFRLVGQRLTTTTQTTTNSVYAQIELNGLARFGTSPLELLRRSVPGYLKTNDPALSPRGGDYFTEF